MQNDVFIYKRRIYYADTDAGGIVYHANYLKFGEEARAEWLRNLGIQRESLIKLDCFFVVTQASLTYRKPALLDDLLIIETRLTKKTGTRFYFSQKFKRDTEIIAEIELVVASINSKGRPRPAPDCFTKLRNIA